MHHLWYTGVGLAVVYKEWYHAPKSAEESCSATLPSGLQTVFAGSLHTHFAHIIEILVAISLPNLAAIPL